MSFRGASKTGRFCSSLQGRDACVTRVAERATPEHERWRQPARNYERGSNKHAFPAKRPPKRYFLIAAVPWGTCTRKFQAGRPPRRGSPSASHQETRKSPAQYRARRIRNRQSPPRNTGCPEHAASNRHQSTRVLQAARSCGHPKSYRLANLRITISAKSCAISCLRIISS
jgi:hypothetical protein